MTEQIIEILGKLDDERRNYNDIKRRYLAAKKVQEKGNNLSVTLAYNMHVRYGNNIRDERYVIKEDDIGVANQVLDALLEYYTQLGLDSKKEIDRLMEKLKSAPSDAATPEQGNETI